MERGVVETGGVSGERREGRNLEMESAGCFSRSPDESSQKTWLDRCFIALRFTPYL